MATLYKCDRCLKIFDNSNETRQISFPFIPDYSRYTLKEYGEKSIDLCESCIKELNDFLKTIPKETNVTR